MTIKQFLTRHVEGYLFKDLRTMGRIKLPKRQKIGGVGYPQLTSVLAGMEMLGGLLQKLPFASRGKSKEYFENYWDNFFVVSKPRYQGYRDAFWQLIRNGIAHTYLTKTGIWVVKGQPVHHLSIFRNGADYYLVVDVGELFKDFKESYMTLVRPIVYAGTTRIVTKVDMQTRLNEMLLDYETQSNSVLGAIQTTNRTYITRTQTNISGASTVPSMSSVVTYSGTVVKKP